MAVVIAEIGSNHLSFEDLKDSIQMAKSVGADIAKIQLYDHKALYGVDGPQMPGQVPLEWLPKLAEKANAAGIELMASAFSPELLKAVDPYVKRHKIASAELTYRQLLEAAKATGKPVLISTGGSSLTDIKMATEVFHGYPADRLTLLYCVSAYPAKNVNLASIDKLKEIFPNVGYSCHTEEWYTPVVAVKYHGATVIEKHFKLRDMDTPDSPHSLNPQEFKEMVDVIRGKAEHICFPEPQERGMLTRHNRRLIATADIMPQDILSYGQNFGVFRSLRDDLEGLHGFADQAVNGKTCKVALKVGDPITPKHVG